MYHVMLVSRTKVRESPNLDLDVEHRKRFRRAERKNAILLLRLPYSRFLQLLFHFWGFAGSFIEALVTSRFR
jgi:hypothetical protein